MITYKGQQYDTVKEAADITGDWYPTIWRVVHLQSPSSRYHQRPGLKPLQPATRHNTVASRRKPLPDFAYPQGYQYNVIFNDGSDETWYLCDSHYDDLYHDSEVVNMHLVLGQQGDCDWCQHE